MKNDKIRASIDRMLLPLMLGTVACGFAPTGGATETATAPMAVAHLDTQFSTVGNSLSTDAGLEEIVVTAQSREASLSKVAVAVTAFGANQHTERSITTETDLQAAVPGLTVKTGENANSVFYAIRGQTLDVASGSSPGVLVYVNDVQISSATAA